MSGGTSGLSVSSLEAGTAIPARPFTRLAEALARNLENKDDLDKSYELFNAALDGARELARELDAPEAWRDVCAPRWFNWPMS